MANHASSLWLELSKKLNLNPHVIGNYKIERILHLGKKNVVLLASHPKTFSPVVIKVLSEEKNSFVIESFVREAEIIKSLDHPNIIKLYSYGITENETYMALEYIEGISLRELILNNLISLRKAINIILQIAHTLTYLHKLNIIHRDLKPENILFSSSNNIKLIDFNISIHKDSCDRKSSSPSTFVLGTPFYMSPEQKVNPQNVSYASDIYSLGIIAYELILGKLSYGQVYLALLPKKLQPILKLMLAPERKYRYQNSLGFIEDLSKYVNSDAINEDSRLIDDVGELHDFLCDEQDVFILPTPKIVEDLKIEKAVCRRDILFPVYCDFGSPCKGVINVFFAESSSEEKGVLLIAFLKGIVTSLINFSRPKEFIRTVNKYLMMIKKSNQKLSAVLLTFFSEQNKLSYISCGHPLLCLRSEKTVEEIPVNNPYLGEKLWEINEDELPWKRDNEIILSFLRKEKSLRVTEGEKNVNLQKELINVIRHSEKIPLEAIARKYYYTLPKGKNKQTVILFSLKKTE